MNTQFNMHPSVDRERLRQLVIDVANEEILPRFQHVRRDEKADGSVITEADLVTQQRIQDELYKRYPDIRFLGEEMSTSEQEALLSSDAPLWILDPLDGTSNFAGGIPHFAVSLALLVSGKVQIGVVYDPVRQECFYSHAGGDACLNDHQLQVKPSGIDLPQATALIDFKRLAPELASRLVTERPYASQRSFGSVALDWCWLAAGRCHVYLHGRSNVWDYAAGHLIFQQAGGYSIGLDGEPLFSNSLKPRASVGALETSLFEQWTEYLGL